MKISLPVVQAGFALPDTFIKLLVEALIKHEIDAEAHQAITFNFRSPDYSAESGGYHPGEVRIEKHHGGWEFAYITDFSYQGAGYPELAKEIDVCFSRQQVYHYLMGWLPQRAGKPLVRDLLTNFVSYHQMSVYDLTLSTD